MDIIQLTEAYCKNCHKCIRNCPVKSISFQNEQARIMEEDCVLCGNCLVACPQNAKHVKSDLDTVIGYIKNGYKVFASVAPSFVSAFGGAGFAELSAALKKLGFTHVEETAIGATQVSAEYGALMEKGVMKNIITTCCPTTVLLIEKYYPDLIGCIAPVISPAMAHAKMMKNMYGPMIKVVFISPCISKKHEAAQNSYMNATLMFDELAGWMSSKGIVLDECDQKPAEMHSVLSRLYPVPGGIIRTIPQEKRKKYTCVSVDGMDRCMEVLNSLRDHPEIEGYFLEMSACTGSCVEGPGLRSFHTPFLISKERVLSQVRKKTKTPAPLSEHSAVDLETRYKNKSASKVLPSDAQIAEILRKIGKTSPEKMYNCGACGYPTCREKAIAVYQGKAELRMCIPYMREKAESMSNVILDNTPNGLIVVDGDFNILDRNAAAVRMLKMNGMSEIGLPVQMLIGSTAVDEFLQNGENIFDIRVTLSDTLTVEQTIVRIEDSGNYLIIVKDVTRENEHLKKLEQIRSETVETAQRVIDKQMRVVQEIASLLGETTGETKAALTRLKKSMAEGEAQ